MKAVKSCLVCGFDNPVDEYLCLECGTSSFGPVHPVGEEPGAEQGVASVAVVSEGALSGRVFLEWPWGAAAVETRLAVGREPSFSGLASRLAVYPNISGRHAEIVVDRGIVSVEDLDSMNGTFVNERPVPPGNRVCLIDGDELRFAATLRVRVRIGR